MKFLQKQEEIKAEIWALWKVGIKRKACQIMNAKIQL
jgi:hypothetical protein